MDRSPERACKGKVTYSSRRTAERVLRKTVKHFGDGGLMAYRCPHCGCLHIGHASKKQQRRLRQQRRDAAIARAAERLQRRTGDADAA